MVEAVGGAVSQRAAVNVVIRSGAEILGKLATLAWTILAARMLTQEDFGAVSYALTVMLVVSSLPSAGLNSTMIRRGSAHPEHLSRYYSENLVWKSVLAVPAVAVAAVMTWESGQTVAATVLMGAFLLSTFPELWSGAARSASAARQRPAGSSAALVLQRVVTAAAISLALLLGLGAAGVAVGFLVGTSIGWVANIGASRRLDVRLRVREVRWAEFKSTLAETWVIGVSAVVLMLLFRVDALILEALAGYDAVADYSVAYRLLETVLFITFAINQAIFPVMSATTSVDRIRRGFERGTAVGAFVYLPFAAVCFLEGEAVVRTLFGEEYAERSTVILDWLVLAPLFYATAFFGSSVLMARRRTGGMLLAALGATVVNVVLNLWLIPRYVGEGAAIATTVSYAVYAVLIHLVVRRTIGSVRLFRPLREAAVASVALAGVLLVPGLPPLVGLTLGGVVYVGVWLLLARRFAPEQIEVVEGLLRRGRRSR